MANTPGEKELKASWDELTASDSTKFIGHNKALVAEEGSIVAQRDLKGIR